MSITRFDRASMAETGLVFGLLFYPQLKDAKGIRNYVSKDDFADLEMGQLFSILMGMQDDGVALDDYVVLITRMVKSGLLEKLGGWESFYSMAQRRASTFLIGNAIEIRELAIRRRMVDAMADATNELEQPSVDQFEVSNRLARQLTELTTSRQLEVKFKPEVAAEIIEDLAQQPKPLVLTGLTKFDRIIGGFAPGELIVIAARTSIGKSAMAAQIAEFNADQELPVLFITLEMDSKDIVRRMLARQSGVDVKTMRAGRLSETQLEAIVAAATSPNATRFIPLYMPASKAQDIRQVVTAIASKFGGLVLVVIDYLQIIKAPDHRMSARESIGESTRTLKRLAGEVGCPIIALSQLNRDATKQETPTLANMAESSSIEADADMVLAIHRQSPNDNEGKLLILKNRNGETADISGLLWSGQSMQFWFNEPRQYAGFEAYQ
jgi:replicative DNA helicase